MSRVVLGVGASHSTLMNTHWPEVAGLDRAEQFRAGLDQAREIIGAARPDAAVIIGSNHFRGLWLDLLPTFTIAVGECVASGESGTPAGPVPVDTELARHMCEQLTTNDFDLAFSARLQIDHGQTHAIQYLLDGLDVPIVPLVINVFAPPLPRLARCEALGTAIADAIAVDGHTKNVVVIGSGGLSHQLPFPTWDRPVSEDDRFLVEAWTRGRDNWQSYDPRRRQIIRSATAAIRPDFDQRVLRLLSEGRLDQLAGLTSEQIEAQGGNGAQEVRAWVCMAAACGHRPGRVIVYSEMPEWLTGMAVAVIDPSEE